MRSDVAIVGAGVIGWSIAAHLLRIKPNLRVEVLDALPSFGMGSTGKAAGGVRAQFGTEINVDLSLYSIMRFEELQEKTDIGFRQYGYLFVATSDETDSYLDLITPMQRQRGVPVERLTRQQVAELAPYLNTQDVVSGSFSRADGYLDPYAVCQAFEREARALGALARYGKSIDALPGATTVVIAAGHWSASVGQFLDLELPVSPEKHQLAMTESAPGLPGRLPMVVDLATSFHFRKEGERLLIGYNDPLGDPNESTEAFDFGFLERMAEVGLHRLPLLENVGFDTKKCWAGFYAETPDHHAIIDRIGDVVVCTGFGGHGIMHSPAAGQAAAELVLYGHSSTFDLSPLRLARFAEEDLTHEPMVI
ncbi:MAG: FAD-binding oxidoreductase [Fimbriimonadales bacterium]|nr:FAD-binding oxidoreductase [Fimbriimonadales bacterium]